MVSKLKACSCPGVTFPLLCRPVPSAYRASLCFRYAFLWGKRKGTKAVFMKQELEEWASPGDGVQS